MHAYHQIVKLKPLSFHFRIDLRIALRCFRNLIEATASLHPAGTITVLCRLKGDELASTVVCGASTQQNATQRIAVQRAVISRVDWKPGALDVSAKMALYIG